MIADRGAAALAKKLHEFDHLDHESECWAPAEAAAILGERGLYLPDGLDALAAKVADWQIAVVAAEDAEQAAYVHGWNDRGEQTLALIKEAG